MLGVPNEKYDSWVLRLDLTKLALHGVGEEPYKPEGETQSRDQEDAVRVTLRRKDTTGTDQ
jgi:hypothetical protein